MSRRTVVATLLCSSVVFLSASWFCWARGDEWVLLGKRLAIDQYTVYLDNQGHLVWSRNEHLVYYTGDVARKVATQPALQANPQLRQFVAELKEYQFAGIRWGRYSTTRGKGTSGMLLAVPSMYIGGLLLAYPAIWLIRRNYARHGRLQLQSCLHCGYSLTGNVSGVCPECGEKT